MLFFRRPSGLSRLDSGKNLRSFRERVETLTALISERDAAISALEYEVRRLNNELQKQTKVKLPLPSGVRGLLFSCGKEQQWDRTGL